VDSEITYVSFIIQIKNISTLRLDLTYNIKEFQTSDGGYRENSRHFCHWSNQEVELWGEGAGGP